MTTADLYEVETDRPHQTLASSGTYKPSYPPPSRRKVVFVSPLFLPLQALRVRVWARQRPTSATPMHQGRTASHSLRRNQALCLPASTSRTLGPTWLCWLESSRKHSPPHCRLPPFPNLLNLRSFKAYTSLPTHLP